jgi:hypothetical protein
MTPDVKHVLIAIADLAARELRGVAWQLRCGGVGVMLLDLVREGEQIAPGCRASKLVKGVKARWHGHEASRNI